MSSIVSSTAAVSATSLSVIASGSSASGPGAQPAAATSSAFGVSVSISVSIAAITQTAGGSTAQDGRQALATLQQTPQALKDQDKKNAAAKLDEAVKELSLLKLLGNTVEGAREAVKLARQIAAAVDEYAAAGGSPAASAVSAATGLPQADTAAPLVAPDAAAWQDPFYVVAGAALTALGKFLKKTLPSLQNSRDPTVRAEARRLAREFGKAASSIEAASTGSGRDAVPSGDTRGTTTVAAGVAASVSVDLVA